MKISKADCPKMIKDTTPVQDGFFMPAAFAFFKSAFVAAIFGF